MTEQEENELICERLLGWVRYVPDGYEGQDRRWKRTITLPGVTGEVKERTPSFTTWADVGLILDALRARGFVVHFFSELHRFVVEVFLREADSARVQISEAAADSGPLAVRAAALQAIASLPVSA